MRVQISVACELSPMCQAAFPGFQHCGRPGGGTVLWGEVADQATLMRLLHRLNDFGLTLLEFRQLPNDLVSALVTDQRSPAGTSESHPCAHRQHRGQEAMPR